MWVKLLKEIIKKSTKPKNVLSLDTQEEASLRNLFKFRTKSTKDFVGIERNLGRL